MGVPTKLAQAKQLAVYWDNYVNYLTTLDDKQPNIGNGKAKPPQTQLYVQPFGLDLANQQYLEANGTEARWTTYKNNFNNYTKETLDVAGGETSLKLKRVRVARVVIKTGMSTTRTVKTAATTKRKYATYGGESGSIPFGQNGASEEIDAYETIVAAIKAGSFDKNTTKISRVKELV